MIIINDNDFPITVAEKIIRGTKPNISNSIMKLSNTIDMYSLEELKEISDYLMVYYNSHKAGD